jgi:hypothetical protein
VAEIGLVETLRLAGHAAEHRAVAEETLERILGLEEAHARRGGQLVGEVEGEFAKGCLVDVGALLVGEPQRVRVARDVEEVDQVRDLVRLADAMALVLVEQSRR